jgi:hypothetical protein
VRYARTGGPGPPALPRHSLRPGPGGTPCSGDRPGNGRQADETVAAFGRGVVRNTRTLVLINCVSLKGGPDVLIAAYLPQTGSEWFNAVFATLSILFAAGCLIYGMRPVDPNDQKAAEDRKTIGTWLVALWVLLPPIFFWVDWCFFRQGLTPQLREDLKHTHELSRNIWIAFIVVLSVLFGVKIPGQ